MSRIDWDAEEANTRDILKGMLEGITDARYCYTENVQANPLEESLFNMVTRISTSKPNLVSVISLDGLGIVGNDLVKLWGLCKEKNDYFEKTVTYITGTILSKCFTRDEVVSNLKLDRPIPFIPDDEMVPFFADLIRINRADAERIILALRSCLVRNYNARVLDNVLDLTVLELPKEKI